MSARDPAHDYGADIYTEADGSDDTLANLGPLAPLAGIWTTWSYEEHTALRVPDRQGLVDHVDRNTLRRIGEPIPNPLAKP